MPTFDVFPDELAILYMALNKLNLATTPAEQLEAISDYARGCGASQAVLYYFDPSDNTEIVADWHVDPQYVTRVGLHFSLLDETFSHYVMQQGTAILITDVLDDNRLEETYAQKIVEYGIRSAVILPLKSRGRWIGGVLFTWPEPFVFNDRDEHIYTILAKQTAPIIDSVRANEQSRNRALDLENANREIDVLYDTLNKLAQAHTPAEQLEAVSKYAREIEATQGALLYFEKPDQLPLDWAIIAASWHSDRVHAVPVGERFEILNLPSVEYLLKKGEPVLIADMQADTYLRAKHQALMQRYGVRGAAILPLESKGRWIGILWFSWNVPHNFTPRDQRVFNALRQQTAPIIDSIRLLEQTRNRALELENANYEIDILYTTLNKLNLATTPAEQLEAASEYARATGATQGLLFFIERPGKQVYDWAEVVAEWAEDYHVPVGIGTYFRTLHMFFITHASAEQLVRPVMWGNIHKDSRLDQPFLDLMAYHKVQGAVLLPLFSRERWIGYLWFGWNTPRHFDARDRRVYLALLQQAAPIIDAIRLLEENRIRALRAEEASRESTLLYRASRAVNAAKTYGDLVAAVEVFGIHADGISLALFENSDYEQATYFEIVAGWPADMPSIGERLPLAEFPALVNFPRDAVSIIEDVLNDPRVDPLSASSWNDRSTRARISIPLSRNNRWVGMLIFCSTTPYRYSALERRLIEGVGDLVTAALERIRLQDETEDSRQRAEIVAQINANLSQASDEQAILSAVGPLATHYGVVLCTLAYASTDESGQITEAKTVSVRASGIGPLETSELPIIAFHFSDFPVIRMAYEHPDKPIFIGDTLGGDDERERTSELGWPAAVILPLQMGKQWQGILSFIWGEAQVFDNEMRQIFAEIQPVVASIVAGRRAYLAEQQRARELQTVAKVSAAASSILDIQELIKAVSELTHANFTDYHIFIYLLEFADRTLIRTNNSLDSGEGRITVPGRVIELANERSLIAHVARQKSGHIVNDIMKSPHFTLAPMLSSARSEMAVPMLINEKLIGVLDVQSEEVNRFTDSDLLVMGTLADLIAVAVENARLYERAQEVAALEERNRLARELHDSVSQALYGIALGTKTARALMDRDPARLIEPLDYIMSLSEAALTEMRALIFDLRPETLENEGLVTVLKKQLASLQARHKLQIKEEFCEEPALSLEAKETLYRIAREALHNTVKHAHASQIVFRMSYTGNEIVMTLADNGIGFEPSADYPGHLGLQSMRERAARLNGMLVIESAPGKGACIQVLLPLISSSET